MSSVHWIFLPILFATDILFVLMRVSLLNVRLTHLMNLRERSPGGVEQTLKLLEKPHLPATVRLVSLINHFLLAAIALWLLIEVVGVFALWELVVVVLVAAIVIIAIEFALEAAVTPNAEIWAVSLTPLTRVVDIIFRPVAWLLLLLLGSETLQRQRPTVTEDELKTWAEDEKVESTLEQGERRMISSIFQFGDTLCREIMVPRIDVFALDVNTSVPEAIEGALRSGHSRLPVYEEAIDNVIGLLYAKDLLRLSLFNEENGNSIRALLRPAYFVPETKKVDELLRELQARGVHMAIVVDEYGGMAGVVTLEDIVEEIVGDIRDEFDETEELTYQQVSPDEYLILGRISLDDLNELLDTHFSNEVADTLGGYIYGQIGRVPVGGESLQVEDWDITVEQVSGRRIRLVRATRRTPDREIEEKQNESER